MMNRIRKTKKKQTKKKTAATETKIIKMYTKIFQ